MPTNKDGNESHLEKRSIRTSRDTVSSTRSGVVGETLRKRYFLHFRKR